MMQAVDSPFAPHGPGDQTQPVDQRVTFYYQGAPYSDVPVDATYVGCVATLRP